MKDRTTRTYDERRSHSGLRSESLLQPRRTATGATFRFHRKRLADQFWESFGLLEALNRDGPAPIYPQASSYPLSGIRPTRILMDCHEQHTTASEV